MTEERIIFLVSTMHTGGAERVAACLVNAWVSLGWKVTLLVTYSGRGECEYPLDERVELLYLADISQTGSKAKFSFLRRFLALRRFIKLQRPVVVVSFLTQVNVAALLSSLWLDVPVFVSERTHPPSYSPGLVWRCLRRLTYPLAERVVLQTEESLEWLRQSIPRARGMVIPNPVSYPLPVGEPIVDVNEYVSAGRKILLAVGRLDISKQFDCLLKAFALLAAKHHEWDLIILGEGPERNILQQLIDSLGLSIRVRMLGQVGNMGVWYKIADLYVMSSKFEGFPNTLLEAMAYGCPAISYDCDTGPRDIIRHEQNGLLVSPVGGVGELADAMDALLGDETRRNIIGSEAIKVRERFSMGLILDRWNGAFAVCSQRKHVQQI